MSLDDPNYEAHYEAVVQELRKRGYHFTGFYHQQGEYGVPVFDDGERFMATFRTWGQVMADAFPDEIGGNHIMAYVHWAWTWDGDQSLIKYPCPEDYACE